jgi:hypothetical protein
VGALSCVEVSLCQVVHVLSCDAESHKEASMAASMTVSATQHDGGVLQPPFPPVLRCFCLAQR